MQMRVTLWMYRRSEKRGFRLLEKTDTGEVNGESQTPLYQNIIGQTYVAQYVGRVLNFAM